MEELAATHGPQLEVTTEPPELWYNQHWKSDCIVVGLRLTQPEGYSLPDDRTLAVRLLYESRAPVDDQSILSVSARSIAGAGGVVVLIGRELLGAGHPRAVCAGRRAM